MYRIAVMGPYDSIFGFSALGLDIFPVSRPEEAAQTLGQLAQGNYAVVYCTEDTAASIADEIARYKTQTKPAVILIPGVSGNTGQGIRDVHACVEQAVGSDILQDKD